MKKLSALFVVLALLAASCGDRGEDESGGVGNEGNGTETADADGGEANPGDWGDLEAVCGPNEGGGAVPADDAQGVSEDEIVLGTVADPGFAARPGLNQELFDAGDAFVEWCNAAGGINGKKLVLNKRDAALTNYQPVIEQACESDFGLVGGGAVQDNLWPSVGAACDLFDIAGFAVTPEKAGMAGDSPTDGRTVQPVPNPSDEYPVGAALLLEEEFPELGDTLGFLTGGLQTLTDQRDKEKAAYEGIGYTTVYDSTYNIGGESNWKPFATAIQDENVSLYKFVGEPTNAAQIDQAFSQVGFTPDVRLFEPNIYDQSYLDAAGPAANGAFVGLAFTPLEEAENNPATQLYVDNLEESGGKTAILGLQSTSAWLLFATLAKECDQNDDLTRSCILEGAGEMTEWTGGGLHAPTSPATNEGSDCIMVVTVEDQKFTRYAPEEDFACDESYQADSST